jgi:hypothetical protein
VVPVSKTVDLSVTITCEDEEDYDRATDSIMGVAQTWSGAMSGLSWDAIPNDDLPPEAGS